MADIKTRDVVKGTIKKIDKAAIAADRMRSAYVQAKEQQLMEALSPQMVRLKLYLYQKTELLFAHQTCQ